MTKDHSCSKQVRAYKKNFRKAASQAVLKFGLIVLGEAQEECPVKTGKLRRSGAVSVTKDTSGAYIINIGFYTRYALTVHESYTYHIVGHSHFLLIPFLSHKNELKDMIKQAVEVVKL
jgi:hypothetical protein